MSETLRARSRALLAADMSWEVLATIIASLGGFELVRWLFTRKSNARLVQAKAEEAEIKADADEYHLLRERLEYADKQAIERDRQYQEQTTLLRETNKMLLAKAVKIGELQAEIARLNAERSMKLCERRGCAERVPQSGY